MVVYSPLPTTQVISVQVDVDFGVARSIKAAVGVAHRLGSVSNLSCLQAVYHSPAAPPTIAYWLLVAGPSASWSLFKLYNSFNYCGKGVLCRAL